MIGKNIKELYDTLKMTQYQFAKMVGHDHSTLSHLESGKTKKPSRGLIAAICSINWPGHGYVNRDWLLTGKGKMFAGPDAGAVNEQSKEYKIPCNANQLCRQICSIGMTLTPADQLIALALFEILKSDRESTKTAIRQNIEEFHELIRRSDQETDFKTPERKRSGSK